MTGATSSILLVEPDILVRHPLAQYLRDCGLKVHEAATAEEARAFLSDRGLAVDTVLIDTSDAEAGFKLLRWVRQQAPGVEVILAGSVPKAMAEAAEICREGPALAKPYEHRLVLERIRQSQAQRAARQGQSTDEVS